MYYFCGKYSVWALLAPSLSRRHKLLADAAKEHHSMKATTFLLPLCMLRGASAILATRAFPVRPPAVPYPPRCSTARSAVFDEDIAMAPWGEVYSVKRQRASTLTGSRTCPALVCIPPVGVGISREFYEPLHRAWAALGAPAELHTPNLLGCGDAQPKRRQFYTPEAWAEQLLTYIKVKVQKPVIIVAQGGLLPVALEMWKAAGMDAVVGISFLSPPPLRFFAPSAEAEPGVRARFSGTPPAAADVRPRRFKQRAFWLLSLTPVGNLFFRYLRGGGKNMPRVRAFSERNLFADSANVDEEWMQMCATGAQDARSRFSTFAYLCGTIPGGAWRDDRSDLLASLNVPCQVLRGDAVEGAADRLAAFVACVPQPSCCGLIAGGRAVLPYEQAEETANELARFLAENFDKDVGRLVRGTSTSETEGSA